MALRDNLISWWSLDEASGTRADSNGSNDLTDNNTVGSATGIISNGADFETSNSEYLSITDASQTGLDLDGGAFSIAFWFKPETESVRHFFFSKYSAATADGYFAEYNGTTNNFVLFCRNDSGADETSISYTLTVSTWYHIVVTNNGTNWELFINGTSQGTNTTRTPQNSAAPFIMGANYVPNSGYVDGILDEFAIWNKVLSSDEISTLYNSGSGISYDTAIAADDIANDTAIATNLVSHWELEESSGTRVDSHGSNDLSDNNTVLSATGIQGDGADFEASNSEYLSVASPTGLDNVTNISFSFWYKAESATGNGTLINYRDSDFAYSITHLSTGRLEVYVLDESNNQSRSYYDTLSTATWYHIGVTFDGSTGDVKIYLDGDDVGIPVTTAATGVATDGGAFELGRRTDAANNYCDGILDEVSIWSRTLQQSEMRAIYNGGSGIPYELTSAGFAYSQAVIIT